MTASMSKSEKIKWIIADKSENVSYEAFELVEEFLRRV